MHRAGAPSPRWRGGRSACELERMRPSCAGSTRASIKIEKVILYSSRWIAGSSPAMTAETLVTFAVLIGTPRPLAIHPRTRSCQRAEVKRA
ncbi:hypothetical protein A33M_3761 [Rhodovulum sp. PH10]|nr:hypothetical protein A33M_3761 [Rhodovulum sp. PH10]